jgi:hypothetical protein
LVSILNRMTIIEVAFFYFGATTAALSVKSTLT